MDAPNAPDADSLNADTLKVLQGFRRKNVSRLMEDSPYRRTVDALGAPDALPFSPLGRPLQEVFCDSVSFLAAMAVQPTAKRKSFEGLWTDGTGKSWKALTEFPNRLRKPSREIEKLNASSVFGPEKWIADETLLELICRQQVLLLPKFLNSYADGIESVTKRLPSVTAKYYWRQKGHSPWVLELSAHVYRCTGRYQDIEVAALLNAARDVLSPRSRSANKGIDAQTLADLRLRRKPRARKT